MKTFVMCLAILSGQMITLQNKPIVRMQPHRSAIDIAFGGDLLELVNTPAIISLPLVPPKTDSKGNPWVVDVKNLGPAAVTVVGKAQFSTQISVGQTVHIYSNGTAYSVNRR
jgi:hypothetical protein